MYAPCETSGKLSQKEDAHFSEDPLVDRAVAEAAHHEENQDERADASVAAMSVSSGTTPSTKPKESETRPGPSSLTQQPNSGEISAVFSESGEIISAPVDEEVSPSQVP